MGTIAIVNILLLFAIIALVFSMCKSEDLDITRGSFIIALFGVVGFIMLNCELFDKPEAMDVYQGKTTLKYTIVDGEKVDSIVVWKKN